ncbi:MAG: APC family permease [Actinomycetota bacterium]|nr:APC family permease [Actinomycetota bacterium]
MSTPSSDQPASLPRRSALTVVKRLLVGRSQPTWHMEHTTLPKVLALPILSSDPLSSVAYATEQIMVVLLAASAGSLHLVMPIAFAIAALLAIVVISYVQVVKGYPSGGGAYVVAKDNLGTLPALIGAGALLVDYVMTVAVSVVAGVVAIVSFAPHMLPYTVELSVGFVVLLTLANLRGVREAGKLFAFPTYAFIACVFAVIVVGMVQCATGGCPQAEPVPPLPGLAHVAAPLGLFVILHAFSSGATALTGVEAISNAVPIFNRPQARNAQRTLLYMGAVAITMFLGVSFLATRAHATVSERRSVVAQIAHAVFHGGPGFYLVQVFTTLILVLAANTSFQGFPRLLAILAQDNFVPRQFRNLGDRLVFSNGIVVLAAMSIVLIIGFDANLDKLIQLYIVGVFTAFTLSQFGMVRHWIRVKDEPGKSSQGWRTSIAINAVGGVATTLVLAITAVTKFTHGAWIAMAAMVVIVVVLESVHRHYAAVRTQLRREALPARMAVSNHVVLLVSDVGPATAEALGYVRSFRPSDLHAVHVSRDGVPSELAQRWGEFCRGEVGLDIIRAPDGKLRDALKGYIAGIPRGENDFVTVVIPELIDEPGLGYLLRRRDLIRLKGSLLREPGIVVADVPVLLRGGLPLGVDGRPLVPTRTVALLFASGVHDATTRAVHYTRSLRAQETRAVFFALGPKEGGAIQEQWAAKGYDIPLDVVEAPFRDLRGPMLEEVRRFTAREDTVVSVVLPELIVRKRRHWLLHNQNALFVKRLLLFEPRVILSSVPYQLE